MGRSSGWLVSIAFDSFRRFGTSTGTSPSESKGIERYLPSPASSIGTASPHFVSLVLKSRKSCSVTYTADNSNCLIAWSRAVSSSDATVAGADLQGVGGTTVPDVGGITTNVEVLRSGYKLLFPVLVRTSFGMIACWEEQGLVEPRVNTENLLYSCWILE